LSKINDSQDKSIIEHGIFETSHEKVRHAMIDKETKRLASIFDAMGTGVYIIDDDYTIKFMNKTSISTFGEGGGKKCYQVIAHRDNVCTWCRACVYTVTLQRKMSKIKCFALP
jgi:hypothetical protein